MLSFLQMASLQKSLTGIMGAADTLASSIVQWWCKFLDHVMRKVKSYMQAGETWSP